MKDQFLEQLARQLNRACEEKMNIEKFYYCIMGDYFAEKIVLDLIVHDATSQKLRVKLLKVLDYIRG